MINTLSCFIVNRIIVRDETASQALKGKVVVMGAGAKNLGGLISRTFGADSASVVVHYNSDSTIPSADETVQAIKAAGGDAFPIQGDLTKVAEVVRLFGGGQALRSRRYRGQYRRQGA
jgi:NAD(P)-dependent dehydrogenase (short-subunit alcohol dehydrogenase family)